MCIITDNNHIVISISLIPGTGEIPNNWHVYFPYTKELPQKGEYFKL